MTPAEIRRLFVVLAGYWPASSPDPDNDLALAGYADLLRDTTLPEAVQAARDLALDGREFCPPPGVLAAASRPVRVPPERVPFELEEAPPVDHETQLENLARLREVVRGIGRKVTSEGDAA